jgi:hypothetical protein
MQLAALCLKICYLRYRDEVRKIFYRYTAELERKKGGTKERKKLLHAEFNRHFPTVRKY